MLNVKAFIDRVVGQGRRAVLLTTRSRLHSFHPYKGIKLTETQSKTGACRLRAKGTSLHQSNAAENNHQISSSGGGIVNLLRPVTSRLFQGLVRRVSSPLWLEARRKGAKRLFGQTAPYFALVGVTLVSGPERGLLTAQDELEAICGDIREAISRAGWIHNPNYWKACKPEPSPMHKEGFSLADFELGPAISKGCSAVVYSAKWKHNTKILKEETESPSRASREIKEPSRSIQSLQSLLPHGSLWLLNNQDPNPESHFSDASAASVSSEDESSEGKFYSFEESSSLNGQFSTLTLMQNSASHNLIVPLSYSCPNVATKSISSTTDFNSQVADPNMSHSPSVQEQSENSSTEDFSQIFNQGSDSDEEPSISNDSASLTYPLAMKMMFNYEAESNAPAILNAMYKEILPAQAIHLDLSSSLCLQRNMNSSISLPLHPNIVDMPCAFIDQVPCLSDGLALYPDALPRRINPTGYGRNMSLFCVMKRYNCTLAEYLSQQRPSTRTSLLLLTQLLEAVNHINKYGIVHRDLKCDNILLCLREGLESPHLVVSDFGCCLADLNLCAPFASYEADPRIGNAALMPPEIKLAVPGMLSWVNYSKADLWAVGTLAYELFGLGNPFVHNCHNASIVLDSASYKETLLPRLPKTVPVEIRCLIQGLLKRNPKQRPSSTVAATVCQLSLWCPRKWLNKNALTLPSTTEVMRWLLCMSSKVLCEAGCSTGATSRASREDGLSTNRKEKTGGQLEYEVISTFLKRVHYQDIIQAIRWIRSF